MCYTLCLANSLIGSNGQMSKKTIKKKKKGIIHWLKEILTFRYMMGENDKLLETTVNKISFK